MNFKSKVIEIEAFEFSQFMPFYPSWFYPFARLVDRVSSGSIENTRCEVQTKNGWVKVNEGDYIIKGGGEIYPCPPDVFAKKYEAI